MCSFGRESSDYLTISDFQFEIILDITDMLLIFQPYSIAGEIFMPIYDLLKEANINMNKCDNIDHTEEEEKNKSRKKPPHAILPEEEDDEVPVHGSDGGYLYLPQFRYIEILNIKVSMIVEINYF